MTAHILTRPLAPSAPRAPAPPKPAPEQAAVTRQKERTKAAEAIARAIGKGRR